MPCTLCVCVRAFEGKIGFREKNTQPKTKCYTASLVMCTNDESGAELPFGWTTINKRISNNCIHWGRELDNGAHYKLAPRWAAPLLLFLVEFVERGVALWMAVGGLGLAVEGHLRRT